MNAPAMTANIASKNPQTTGIQTSREVKIPE
jgi:hypothetical protein